MRHVPCGQLQHRRRHDLRVQLGLHQLRLGGVPDLHRMHGGHLHCHGRRVPQLPVRLVQRCRREPVHRLPQQQRQHVGILHVHVLCRLLQLRLGQHACVHQYVLPHSPPRCRATFPPPCSPQPSSVPFALQTVCAANQYSVLAGSTSCTACPTGSTSSAGATTCTCSAGYATTGTGSTLSCTQCTAGNYSPSGTTCSGASSAPPPPPGPHQRPTADCGVVCPA